VTGYGLDDRSLIASRDKDLPFYQIQMASGPGQAPLSWILSPEIKQRKQGHKPKTKVSQQTKNIN
jgi:hypothetical protein